MVKRCPSKMIRFKWWWSRRFSRLWENTRHRFYIIKFVTQSLLYNEFLDKYYAADTVMEPMFWFVDHFTKAMGPIFVVGVFILMTLFISLSYIIGLPYWIRHSIPVTIASLIIGHWILVNVIFHYYMALTTPPGYPPEGELITEAASICKKCISPKPPRTHHCSVCDKCILKMDHHCPWLNNCIGHFNHRYFFLFCTYTWIGMIFVIVFGHNIGHEHFWRSYQTRSGELQNVTQEHVSSIPNQSVKPDEVATNAEMQTTTEASSSSSLFLDNLYHGCIIYQGLVCIGVFFALGALIAWHARQITRGETSVESHINKKERERYKKAGKVYRNPYDFGPRKNWRIFLGLTHGRGWRHVLLPSVFPPEGDGLHWYWALKTSRD